MRFSKFWWALSGRLGFPGYLPEKEEGCLQKMEGSWMLQNGRNTSQGQVFKPPKNWALTLNAQQVHKQGWVLLKKPLYFTGLVGKHNEHPSANHR